MIDSIIEVIQKPVISILLSIAAAWITSHFYLLINKGRIKTEMRLSKKAPQLYTNRINSRSDILYYHELFENAKAEYLCSHVCYSDMLEKSRQGGQPKQYSHKTEKISITQYELKNSLFFACFINNSDSQICINGIIYDQKVISLDEIPERFLNHTESLILFFNTTVCPKIITVDYNGTHLSYQIRNKKEYIIPQITKL